MKNNNLFRKFLALFLTGTMLAGVGCKDYDDDIDDINKKIDDLNAKVELKADASALQTISDKLKDVDFSKFVTDAELSQELAAYVKDADLKKKVGDLGFQTVTQVQDLIKGLQNEAQVKALIEIYDAVASPGDGPGRHGGRHLRPRHLHRDGGRLQR